MKRKRKKKYIYISELLLSDIRIDWQFTFMFRSLNQFYFWSSSSLNSHKICGSFRKQQKKILTQCDRHHRGRRSQTNFRWNLCWFGTIFGDGFECVCVWDVRRKKKSLAFLSLFSLSLFLFTASHYVRLIDVFGYETEMVSLGKLTIQMMTNLKSNGFLMIAAVRVK